MTLNLLYCARTSEGNLSISIFFFHKKFFIIFCTFLTVEKYYTTLICLKQAIQPRVVGPLFIKRCIVYIVAKFIVIGCGTSIDTCCVSHGALAPWQERLRPMFERLLFNQDSRATDPVIITKCIFVFSKCSTP